MATASAVVSCIQAITSKLIAATDHLCQSVEADLKQMMGAFDRIQATLNNAEMEGKENKPVKVWLKNLKVVSYDAEDVLDEFQYDLLRSESETSRKRKREQVSDLTSTKIKIKEIRERFDLIERDGDALGLNGGTGVRRLDITFENHPPLTSSDADELVVLGREDDKERIIELLLSDMGCKFSVIPILGVGGLGKTTLSRLVCDDPVVCENFNCIGWVSKLDDFDLVRITRDILESIARASCDFTEAWAIHACLEGHVSGKKVLLVLDDMVSVERGSWDSFKTLFISAKVVKVIVTTRNDSVADIMQTMPPYRLDCLTEDQSWLLFQQHAFGGRDPSEGKNLRDIGKQIVMQCGGLPLAIRMLGGLLRYESDQGRWRDILHSSSWASGASENGILPTILQFSYHHMPSPLKSCFLYTSMFPRNHKFEKDQIVKLWIAQGYVQPRGTNRIQDIGNEYFYELQRRSFFQHAGISWVDGKELFVVHGMIHELARSISADECCSVESKDDKSVCSVSNSVRHLYVESVQKKEVCLGSLPLEKPKALRTLINKRCCTISSESMLLTFECLRTLELGCVDFPASVCNLKQLRYLCLRNSSIIRLPTSVCHLYSLKILDLKHCPDHILFPRGIEKLVNLRHLFLPVKSCMPHGIGKLTNLQELNVFNVQKDCRHCGWIGELNHLSNFTGKLVIQGLRDVDDIEHAKEANLRSKQYLQELTLIWRLAKCKHGNTDFPDIGVEAGVAATDMNCNDDDDVSRPVQLKVKPMGREKGVLADEELAEAILESLQPQTNLRELTIRGYSAIRFPSWVANPMFSKLTTLKLVICGCKFLPPLGQLPSLRYLELSDAYNIKLIGPEFYSSECRIVKTTGAELVGKVRFPSLEELKIRSFQGLIEWSGVEDGDFPCLRKLSLNSCYELRKFPSFPSLQSLHMDSLSDLTSLSLHVYWEFCSSLKILHVINCVHLRSLVGLHNLYCLEELNIKNNYDFQFSPKEQLPSSLRTLCISDCKNLMSFIRLQNLTSLVRFELKGCSRIKLFPEERLPPRLQILHISDCWKLASVLSLRDLTFLKSLKLERCFQLRVFPDEGLSSIPKHVDIIDCPGLREWCQIHGVNYTQDLSAQNELIVSSIMDILERPGVDNLLSLEYLCLKNCNPIPKHSYLPSMLKTLQVCFDYYMESIPLHQNLSSLKRMIIRGCKILNSVVGLHNLTSLQSLFIYDCPEFQLQTDQRFPSMLQTIVVHGCDKLRFIPLQHQDLAAMMEIQIWNCCRLTSIAGLNKLSSLQSLTIKQCPRLQFSTDEHLSSNLRHVEIEDCPGLRNWCEGHQIPYKQ